MRSEFGSIYCKLYTTNKIWAGIHWAERKRLKDECRESFSGSQLADICTFTQPVCLSFTPLVPTGKRLFDTSNYSAMVKAIEDCMVEGGVFIDDNAKYVRQILINPPVRAHDSGFFVQILETPQFQIEGLMLPNAG